MKLYAQADILKQEVRKKIIDEILASPNQKRKRESLKRYEVFKDNTVKYVLKKLQNEIKKKETLQLMSNRASNISIAKKVIRKLARCYNADVVRSTGEKTLDERVSYLAMLLDWNTQQKKADQYERLQKTCMTWFTPEEVDKGKFKVNMRVLSPWQFDAVESAKDPSQPLAIVLSDFVDTQSVITSGGNQVNALDATAQTAPTAIADGPGVATYAPNAETFIFWTDDYHLTCDKNGKIIPELTPENLENPIGEIPGVVHSEDADGEFWARGGEDLVDGAILINTLITDMFAIMFMQGWGQLVITGQKGAVPQEFAVGPHQAIIMEYDSKKDEAKPTIEVVSANPPIEAWMRAIEQFTALLLSTNGLSPTAVAAKLDAASFPSGIALLVERSEATEDVSERQNTFSRKERREWRIYGKWHNLYASTNSLDTEFAAAGKLPEDLDVAAKFRNPGEVTTEKERLENMALRKDLGIATQLDLLMQDNPGMTREEAEQKLLEIKKQELEDVAKEMARTLGEKKDPAAPAPEAKDPKAPPVQSAEPAGEQMAKQALNGAQVASLVQIVVGVANGEIPRDSGLEMIQAAFPFIDAAWAAEILSTAGKGFTTKPAPTNTNPDQGGQ